MPPEPTRKKLRVPDEIVQLVRRAHPRLKVGIRMALNDILGDPFCGKALKEELEGLRTYRIKRFRIIYRIAPKYIEVIAIGPRKSIYEETFRIISKVGSRQV